MNPKQVAALIGVVVLVGSDITHEPCATLVPREHVHVELRTESVATTTNYLAASGRQSAFDNEALSPAMPWARRSRGGDEGLKAAAIQMIQLGQSE
jgi:hypothetical protein